MKESSHRLFAKYQVKADPVSNFLTRYYKPDRYTARGEEYVALLLSSYQKEILMSWASAGPVITIMSPDRLFLM